MGWAEATIGVVPAQFPIQDVLGCAGHLVVDSCVQLVHGDVVDVALLGR